MIASPKSPLRLSARALEKLGWTPDAARAGEQVGLTCGELLEFLADPDAPELETAAKLAIARGEPVRTELKALQGAPPTSWPNCWHVSVDDLALSGEGDAR